MGMATGQALANGMGDSMRYTTSRQKLLKASPVSVNLLLLLCFLIIYARGCFLCGISWNEKTRGVDGCLNRATADLQWNMRATGVKKKCPLLKDAEIMG